MGHKVRFAEKSASQSTTIPQVSQSSLVSRSLLCNLALGLPLGPRLLLQVHGRLVAFRGLLGGSQLPS